MKVLFFFLLMRFNFLRKLRLCHLDDMIDRSFVMWPQKSPRPRTCQVFWMTSLSRKQCDQIFNALCLFCTFLLICTKFIWLSSLRPQHFPLGGTWVLQNFVPPNGKCCGQRPESQIILIKIQKVFLKKKWTKTNSGQLYVLAFTEKRIYHF